MNNISEGYERESNSETAHFINIAKGSCGEVRNMYYIAEDRNYVTKEIAEDRRLHAMRISSGLYKFNQGLYASDPKLSKKLLKDAETINNLCKSKDSDFSY